MALSHPSDQEVISESKRFKWLREHPLATGAAGGAALTAILTMGLLSRDEAPSFDGVVVVERVIEDTEENETGTPVTVPETTTTTTTLPTPVEVSPDAKDTVVPTLAEVHDDATEPQTIVDAVYQTKEDALNHNRPDFLEYLVVSTNSKIADWMREEMDVVEKYRQTNDPDFRYDYSGTVVPREDGSEFHHVTGGISILVDQLREVGDLETNREIHELVLHAKHVQVEVDGKVEEKKIWVIASEEEVTELSS